MFSVYLFRKGLAHSFVFAAISVVNAKSRMMINSHVSTSRYVALRSSLCEQY